jgi:polyisoprenyl-teichoic acid--peptidoglycan teichoic acid transferase
MTYIERNNDKNAPLPVKKRFYQKKWFRIVVPIVIIFLLIGGFFAWKTGYVINKVFKGGVLSTMIHAIPGVKDELKGEEDSRINILLLGMRGKDVPGGGLLADTIMVVSIQPQSNKAAMISIPRDLYVTDPNTGNKEKINAVHAQGEEKGEGQGLEAMEKIISEVTGLPIHYGISINFAGFKQLVDAVGGVEVNLEQPFSESMQFREEHVCDPYVFTVPTGNYEIKKSNRTGKIKAQYPLCINKDLECGGDFKLPAGKQTLNGEKALCYVRSRATSNDFERAKRQQLVIQSLKDKMVSAGTLTDFSKINGILDSLGQNVRTDMQLWEMQRFYDLYKNFTSPDIVHKVLDNSEEGLLYNPPENGAGYILLPRGDNYERIRQMAKDILPPPANDANQSQ